MLRFEHFKQQTAQAYAYFEKHIEYSLEFPVCLGIPIKNCIAGMLLTCAIEMELKKAWLCRTLHNDTCAN